MSSWNILLLLGCCLCLSLNPLSAQKRQLEKAAKKGPTNGQWDYVATFKNLKSTKRAEIHSWCRANDYVIIDVDTKAKDRFGGGPETFISKVIFRKKEDDYFLKNNSSLTGLDRYLSKYLVGRHRKKALIGIVDKCHSISEAHTYARKYPIIEDRLTLDVYERTIRRSYSSMKWHSEFVKYFPQSEYVKDIKQRMCSIPTTVDDCISYAKDYRDLTSCLAQTASSIALRKKKYSIGYKYLQFFGATTPKSESIWSMMKYKLSNLNQCKDMLIIMPLKKEFIYEQAKIIGDKGNFDVKKEHLFRFPNSPYHDHFKKIVHEEQARVKREKEEAERQRIEAERKRQEIVKRKRNLEEAERRAIVKAKDEAKRKKIAANKALISSNSNPRSWKLGCDLCKFDGKGTIVHGILDQVNSNKSKVKVKLVWASVNIFNGQTLYRDEYIWADINGWYYCPGGPDRLNTFIWSKAETIANEQRSRQREIEADEPKYNYGSYVQSVEMGGESYWTGTVIDIRGKVYKVELTKVYIGGAWYKIYLLPSDCTGNKRLEVSDGYGTEIWVPEDCIR